MKFESWNRPNKNVVRNIGLPTKLKMNTCWLPGEEAFDFLDAYRFRKINSQGTHILVERDPFIAEKITEHLKTIEWETFPTIYTKDLETLKLSKPLDYLNADFCGNLNEKVATWINNDLHLENDAEVVFNFCYPLRGNLFIKECDYLIKTYVSLSEMYNREFSVMTRDDKLIATYCVVLRCLLRRYECKFTEKPMHYRDKAHPMVTYMLHNSCELPNPYYPDILKILKEEREKATKIYQSLSLTDSISLAKTPIEKRIIQRRVKRYIKQAIEMGDNPVQVVAGFKAALTKKGKNHSFLDKIIRTTKPSRKESLI